jgi:hypothetical protein
LPEYPRTKINEIVEDEKCLSMLKEL